MYPEPYYPNVAQNYHLPLSSSVASSREVPTSEMQNEAMPWTRAPKRQRLSFQVLNSVLPGGTSQSGPAQGYTGNDYLSYLQGIPYSGHVLGLLAIKSGDISH